MHIKNFEMTYGGYCATNYEVKKHRNKLAFKKWDYSPFQNLPSIAKLSIDDWTRLVHQVVHIIKDWDTIYDSDICDGIQWTVIINTDMRKYDIYGSNNFPENFYELIDAIRGLSGLEKFAEGYDSSTREHLY